MEEKMLSEFYGDEKNRSLSVDTLKFWLMPFVFFVLLGFPTRYGSFISICCNFAAPAFFILCGFFNLPQDREVRLKKIEKALKRSFIIFAVMFVSYILINIIYLAYDGKLTSSLAEEIFRKRVMFNFLALNVWFPLPMGSSIWFIHSLVYAYIFFLVAEKLKLSKLYLPLLIVLCIIMLATGEFAAITGFPYFKYPYIPGGAITRAIPYMLIGMFIRKNIDKLGKVKRYVYTILFFAGLGLTVAEFIILHRSGLLVYASHAIGLGVMAISLCCFTLVAPTVKKRSFYTNHSRNYVRRMYILCQPVSLFVYIVGPFLYPPFAKYYGQCLSIVSFAICFLISLTIGTIKHTALVKEHNQKH